MRFDIWEWSNGWNFLLDYNSINRLFAMLILIVNRLSFEHILLMKKREIITFNSTRRKSWLTGYASWQRANSQEINKEVDIEQTQRSWLTKDS